MQNKNPTIDIARGIAIILVVYGHVIEHSMAPWSEDFFQNPIFKIIYTFHMPLFVFISGYLMADSLNRHSIKEVLKSRCKSLFIPFVSLAVLGSIVMYFLNILFGNNTGRVDFLGQLADQLLLKPSVWFLFTLFALSCLLLFSKTLEKRAGVIIFAPIYLVLMVIPHNDYGALYYIKWFYLFYVAGYFLNKANITIPNASLKTIIFIVSLILFGWLIYDWNTNDYIYINKMNLLSGHCVAGILRIMYRCVMGFLGISIIFYISNFLSKSKLSFFLGLIGIYSLDIYIVQMFIVEGIYPRLIYKAGIHQDFNNPYILYIITPIVTMIFVGICILISKLLIRKSHLLNKLLLGGRV